MRRSLGERADFIPRVDYRRAYALLEGEDKAAAIVDEMFARLVENPDDHLVLDPKFLALLSLFSEAGKSLATALLSNDELRTLRWELVRDHKTVADAFPAVLAEWRASRVNK